MQLVMKNNRQNFHAHIQLLRLDKGNTAELRIIGDEDIFGIQASGQDRERDVSHGDLTTEGARQLALDRGPERFSVHKEWDQRKNEHSEDSYCSDG